MGRFNSAKWPRVLLPLVLAVTVLFATKPLGAAGPNDSPLAVPSATSTVPKSLPTIFEPGLDGASGDGYVPGELIVKFKPGISRSMQLDVASSSKVKPVRNLLLPNYSLVAVPPGNDVSAVMADLRRDPNIELVERNAYRYAYFTPDDDIYSWQWHLPQIQMPQAWDLSTGSGVIVAVLDTGVAYDASCTCLNAPDLATTEFVPGWDFVNNDSHPTDDNKHGTHVAGIIAQSTNNHIGGAGIAYGAKIMPIKVLDSDGVGSDADIIDGIMWAADHGAKVINLSLGAPYSSTAEEDAVNYAYGKGALVIAAAGNSGSGSIMYPAGYANAIAVGAVRYDETRPSYSNYGPQLDLVAPGGDLTVDQNGDIYADGILQQTFVLNNPLIFKYSFEQGTSMAAANVSGVAALLIAFSNATSPDQIRQALQATARDLGTPGWDQYYGHGLVQAYDALLYLGAAPPTSTPIATATATKTSTPTETATAIATASPIGTQTVFPLETATPLPVITPTPDETTYFTYLPVIMREPVGGW